MVPRQENNIFTLFVGNILSERISLNIEKN